MTRRINAGGGSLGTLLKDARFGRHRRDHNRGLPSINKGDRTAGAVTDAAL